MDQAMKPKSGQVRMTRRRWDYLFLPAFVVTALIGVGLWWTSGKPKELINPIGLLPMWAVFRWLTPREGQYERTIAGTPGLVPMMLWFGIWVLGVGVCGCLILNHLVPLPNKFDEPAPPLRTIQIWVGFVLAWFIGLFTVANQIERRVKKRQDEDELPLE
jgi:hypothetical protein